MWTSASLLCFVLVLNEVCWVNSAELNSIDRKCPSGWEKFGSQCFKLFKEWKSWAEAEEQCIEHGGNLASVHSKVTHDFLKSFVKKQVGALTRIWIGAHDAPQEFVWLWSDGSKFSYKDWHTGEPNNGEGAERCVEMGYGDEHRWNDARCSSKLRFVCHRIARIGF